jgi:cytoskeletal protein CcmA (bactofilin family)
MTNIIRINSSIIGAVCIAILINITTATQAIAADVTLTLTIPSPASAQTSVTVRVCDDSDDSCRSTTARFPVNNARQTVTVTGVSNGTKYIRTDCFSNCGVPLLRQGFASGNGQSSTEFVDRLTFIVGGANVVFPEFALATGSVISGALFTPIPQSANRRVSFEACPIDDGACVFKSVTLAANANSVNYAIAVPKTSSFEVSFNCFNCTSPLFSEGFYSATSENNTSTLADNATILNGAQDNPNINMSVVIGATFTGTVFSPIPVPSNTRIRVSGSDISADFNVQNSVTIPAGQSSINYSLALAPENDWVIKANCSSCPDQGLFKDVFYSENEPNTSSWNLSRATEVSGSGNQTVNNLTLFPGAIISGSVTMPDASRAQNTSLEVFAFNQAENDVTKTSAFVSRSSASGNYSLSVPAIFTAEDPVIVGVHPGLDSENNLGEDYVPYAFFDGTNTSQTNRSKAITVVSNAGDVAATNIFIETGNVISGTINMPNAEDAQSDLLIHMIGDQQNNSGANLNGFDNGFDAYGGYGGTFDSGNYLYNGTNAGLLNYAPLKISANSGSSRPYSFRISSDPDTRWRTYYGCLNCGSEFSEYGFFRNISGNALNPRETVTSASQANFVPGGSDYTRNLFLVKPSQQEICFPIKTASGAVAVICL